MEELGYVNPLTKKNSVNKERALYWLGVGAKATPRIHNLFVSEKVIEVPKINTFKITKKAKGVAVEASKAAAAAAAAAPKEEPKAEEAPVETPAPAEEPKAEPRSEAEASTTGEEPKPEESASPADEKPAV